MSEARVRFALFGFSLSGALLAITGALAMQPHFGDSHLDFAAIEAELSQSLEGSSLDSFLERLVTRDPNYFKYFTLMKRSRSLQEASSLDPRAIVYGSTSKLILTFNGDSKQKGFNALELIHFNEEQKSFEFREILFSSTAVPKMSAPNPPKCMRCHGVDLHPLWEPYREWPGAYGSNDDTIRASTRPGSEYSQLLAFRKRASTHPRYKVLKIERELPMSPYSPQEFGDYRDRPNLRLLEQLSAFQIEKVKKNLFEHPLFENFKPLVASETQSCRLVSGSYARELYEKFPRQVSAPHQDLLWSVLNFVGIDEQAFSLSFANPTWVFFEGFKNLHEILYGEIDVLLRKSKPEYYVLPQVVEGSDIPAVGEEPTGAVPELSCEKLRAAWNPQVAELRAKEYLKASETTHFKTKVISMCMSCHDGSDEESDAPYLPLDDAEALRADPALRVQILRRTSDGASADEQMPPNRALGFFERQALVEYLETLSR